MSTLAAQKMKFSIKDFFSKCYQIRSKLRIWSYLLKKSLKGNFIFCAVLPCGVCSLKTHTPQKMKFSNKGFFSKCGQICSCRFGYIY